MEVQLLGFNMRTVLSLMIVGMMLSVPFVSMDVFNNNAMGNDTGIVITSTPVVDIEPDQTIDKSKIVNFDVFWEYNFFKDNINTFAKRAIIKNPIFFCYKNFKVN